VLRDAWAAGTLAPAPATPEPSAQLAEQLRQLSETLVPDLPGATVTRALIAWTQLFGMISFELFGQLVGSVDPSDGFFANATEQMAQFVGLSPG
jgi:hypothetical protein